MVDQRNTTRRQLNRLAHRLRQVNGEISVEEIIASGERRFSVGDRVTARAPNRDLYPDGNRKAYVRNGALGTVVALQPHPKDRQQDTLLVDFDGIGTIELPRSFFDHHRTAGGRTEVGIDGSVASTDREGRQRRVGARVPIQIARASSSKAAGMVMPGSASMPSW